MYWVNSPLGIVLNIIDALGGGLGVVLSLTHWVSSLLGLVLTIIDTLGEFSTMVGTYYH